MMMSFKSPRIALLAVSFTAAVVVGCGFVAPDPNGSNGAGTDTDTITCVPPQGTTGEFETAKIYIEHNATDEDTGVHGIVGVGGTREACIFDSSGQLILAIKPQGNLGDLGVADTFLESREPPNTEPGFTIDDILAKFPEGTYTITGVSSVDGQSLTGTALFTHTIPEAPVITSPGEDAVVSPNNLVVSWEPVTQSFRGEAVDITGYEVIITKDVDDDPNGFSRPTLSVHVPPSQTSLTVPNEFLETGAPYELEVLVIEFSGNQTIGIIFFETESEAVPATVPSFSAANFTDPTNIDNPFFPLTPGAKTTFQAELEDGTEEIIVEVLSGTREVMSIDCRIVRDRVFLDGVLIEDTFDWYAQDDEGNVWYMGEGVTDYNYDAAGALIDVAHEGEWEGGRDVKRLGTIASSGYIMRASPTVGDVYHQEFYAGEAEDMGEVVSLTESVNVPGGSYEGCLKTRDFTSLEPDAFAFKYYCPGVGVVLEEEDGVRVELISVSAE